MPLGSSGARAPVQSIRSGRVRCSRGRRCGAGPSCAPWRGAGHGRHARGATRCRAWQPVRSARCGARPLAWGTTAGVEHTQTMAHGPHMSMPQPFSIHPSNQNKKQVRPVPEPNPLTKRNRSDPTQKQGWSPPIPCHSQTKRTVTTRGTRL